MIDDLIALKGMAGEAARHIIIARDDPDNVEIRLDDDHKFLFSASVLDKLAAKISELRKESKPRIKFYYGYS